MKKSIYVALCAVGIASVTGCMSLEEIKAATEKAKAERLAEAKKRKEEKEKANAKKFAEAKKSADAGDGRMASETAFMLEKGIGVKQNSKQAIIYYEKAVQAGNQRPNWHILNLICKTGDTDHSKLFGDCYQQFWEKILAPNVWDIKNKPNFGSYERFKKSYENSVKVCLNYLGLLQKAGKDTETYALKKRLISIVQKKPSGAVGYTPSMVADFLKKLKNIETKEEKRIAEEKLAEQKRIAEQKMKAIKKYPFQDLAHGMKLYKHLSSGISLEWFILETLSKDGQIGIEDSRWSGGVYRIIDEKRDYCLAIESTVYPEVIFKFASNQKKPKRLVHIDWSIYNKIKSSDLQGVLFEVEISLPSNIDIKKIYQKYHEEYPRIKPAYSQEISFKAIDHPAAYGYRMKIKNGTYIWKNKDIYISFSFSEYDGIFGIDREKAAELNQIFKGKLQGTRKILIRDEKIYRRFVTSKIENNKNQEAQKALDF